MLAEIASSLFAFTLVVSLSPLGARIFAHNPDLTGLFMFYGLSVLANLMYESGSGLLQFFDQFRMIAYISVAQSALTLLLIVGAFLVRGGLEMVVFAYLVGKVALALSISVAALWQARVVWGSDWWRVPLSVLADRRSDLIRFAINTNLSGTLKLITRDSEMLWLGAFSTPLQVGYYKIAKAITNLLMMPVTPLITTTYREVAREVASERWRNVRYLLRSGSILSASWTLPVSLGLVVFGQWVVAIYGREFLPTSYINLLLLLIGVIVVNIFFWSRSVLLPLGMPEYPTKVLFVGAIFKIIGTVLLVPRWGANAMAVLLTGFFLFTTSVLIWKTLREVRNAELVPAVSIAD
jgi:O-antigen/teichoic acid export membrane protein